MSLDMPIVSFFLGIIVRINFGDHNPPHLHAAYGEAEALFEIRSGRVLAGALPRRETRRVLEWIEQNRDALLRNWDLAAANKPTFKIEGLRDE